MDKINIIVEKLNLFENILENLMNQFDNIKNMLTEFTQETMCNRIPQNLNENLNNSNENHPKIENQSSAEFVPKILNEETIQSKEIKEDFLCEKCSEKKSKLTNYGNDFFDFQRNAVFSNFKFNYPQIVRNQNSGISAAKICTFGDVFISAIDKEGRFIKITSSSRFRIVDIGNYIVQEIVGKKLVHVFALPPKFSLKPLRSIKIFAASGEKMAESEDFVNWNISRWVASFDSVFILCRDDGKAISWALGPECNVDPQSLQTKKIIQKSVFNRPQSAIIRVRKNDI